MAYTHEEIFSQRKDEVATVIGHISSDKTELEKNIANPEETIKKMKREDRDLVYFMFNQMQTRLHEARFSEKSPFFSRLTVKFDDKTEQETIYIGKFSFLPEFIYSWTAPVANLRFATPGPFSYIRPNGQVRTGIVFNREDFFIANGKIISLYDVNEKERVLIYDEYISTKRTGFGLADIVRELERAQNEIIVLKPEGSMVISGPAGSGKTTLALHRVAYLLQNPDTSLLYKPERSIIFVQDKKSIDYFGSLFVSLGVEGVTFTTFELWCASILDLSREYSYVDRYGESSILQDWFEWKKVSLIKQTPVAIKHSVDPWKNLEFLYSKEEDVRFQKLWREQKGKSVLDKQDLTALLKLNAQSTGGKVERTKKVWKKKAGKMVQVNAKAQVEFDVVLVDEFENYTPTQLQLVNTTLSQKASCLFVGDIRQQTRFGSVSDFAQSDIEIPTERNIILNKVYRNSSAVLQLLQSLNYKVTLSNQNQTEGFAEWKTMESLEVANFLERGLVSRKDEQVGILCYDANNVTQVRELFSTHNMHVHIGTVAEFQGLEFDTVFVLDVNAHLFAPTEFDLEFNQERKLILREQLYVAITRARSGVVVFSDSAKEDIMTLLSQ